MDGPGNDCPGGGVGGGRRAAQPEDLRAQQSHIRGDSGEDGQHGLLEACRAVPRSHQAAEEDLQALLQQPQVGNAGRRGDFWF